MSKKFKAEIPTHAPTPPEVFFSRRKFMTTMAKGILLSPTVFLATGAKGSQAGLLDEPIKRPDIFPAKRNEKIMLPEGHKTDLTPREVAASHNNFYEFLPGRGGPVWKFTDKFDVDPWKIEIAGQCNNPMTLDLDDLFKIELVSQQPKFFWEIQRHEYGFLSNVNPNIPHPRWSQEKSYWLDTGEPFKTPIFNGYDKYVGQLYPDEPRTPQMPLREDQIAR